MNVTYWTGFSKRKNSTKRPATTGTDATCVLKDDTSILFPDIDSATIPANANYMYIADFGRYYYVRDVTKVGATRNAFHLEVDPMASYKVQIGSTNAFIAFTTSGDPLIADSRLPMSQAVTLTTPSTATFPWTISANVGCIVVTAHGINGPKHYTFTPAGLADICNDLEQWTDDTFNGVVKPVTSNLWDWLEYIGDSLKTMGRQIVSFKDAMSCFMGATWMPIDYSVISAMGPGAIQMYLGEFNTGQNVNEIYNKVVTQTANVSIPWQYNDWRDASPYTQVHLYIPFIGHISYDASNLIGRTGFNITFALNPVSGKMSVEIKSGTDVLGVYGADIGDAYPIGANVVNPVAQITTVTAGAAGIIGGIATGNAAAITAGAGALAGAATTFTPTPSTTGGLGGGSAAGLDTDIMCWTVSRNTSEAPGASAAIRGIPYMKHATISTKSGYVQCMDTSIDIPGLPEEKDAVNGYVNSGFYYE